MMTTYIPCVSIALCRFHDNIRENEASDWVLLHHVQLLK